MSERLCPRCKKAMGQLEGEYVLLPGADVPAWGSKTEVMITPKKSLRVVVWKCQTAECGVLELTQT